MIKFYNFPFIEMSHFHNHQKKMGKLLAIYLIFVKYQNYYASNILKRFLENQQVILGIYF